MVIQAVHLLDIEHFDSFSIFSFKKQTLDNNLPRIALFYRSPKLSVTTFLDQPTWKVSRNVDIVFGDFNIDALYDEGNVSFKNLMKHYQLVDIELTHLDGGIISFLRKMQC